ncbi:U11/U12 small nuclear ribonucleoprotein 48 kDa protein-like [Xenia sp. Carnegie-2017]|uniref:U11/U12 small nuclear ribonucleoprotein 48 kDa protein-like n=1 Tax=Xenia sp. Carnegie-2017 TaxID=2897299 RepID=UPI001F04F57A|nr:U11/U12 small nuclear ribonucleoprotein 48 kDa protein-like [Xenia sp. Carnegie-2017]
MQNLHMDAEKSDTVIRARLNKINELSEILKNSDRFIEKISQRFKWNAESRSQNEGSDEWMLHKQPMMRSCDLEGNKSSKNFYENSNVVISLERKDTDSKEQLIPAQLQPFAFTPEERLHQYNLDVNMSKSKREADHKKVHCDLSELTNLDDKEETPIEGKKSELEILAEQRDYKRRRQSYRAKNVHITKRSPLEITREIINNRMQELQSNAAEFRSGKRKSTSED